MQIIKENPMNDECAEILGILQEECAEVTVAVSKISRFGLDSKNPTGGPSNKVILERELGDILAMIKILVDKKYVDLVTIDAAIRVKISKLKIFSNIDLRDIHS